MVDSCCGPFVMIADLIEAGGQLGFRPFIGAAIPRRRDPEYCSLEDHGGGRVGAGCEH